MTTYNTNNPLGSSDPRDLYDNSQSLDKAVNDTEGETWTDRFGVVRPTIQKALNDLTVSGGRLFDTREDLEAVTPTYPGFPAEVTKDPDVKNNGRWAYDFTTNDWYKIKSDTDEEIEQGRQTVIENMTPVGFDEYEDVVLNKAGWILQGVNNSTSLFSGNWDKEWQSIGTPLLDVEFVDVNVNEDGYIVSGITWDSRTISDAQVVLPNVYVKMVNGHQHVMLYSGGREIPLGTAAECYAPSQDSTRIQWIEQGYLNTYQRYRDMPFSAQPVPMTSVIHYIGYGQSLGVGLEGQPAILQTPPKPDRVFMFAGGVIPAGGAAARLEDDETQSFEPGKNVWINECPVLSGACRIADGVPDTLFVSSFARNGTKIEDLSRGSQAYDNMIHCISHAYSWCMYHGIAYKIAPISFIHGTANSADTPEVYKGKIEIWYNQLNDDIKRITGQTEDIRIILDQARNGLMGLSQFQLALEFPDRYRCVGPQSYGHLLADFVHMMAPGYLNEGAKAGRAVLNWDTWWPLYPTSAIRTGTTVVLTFHNPSGTPLVLDTVTVTNMADGMYGFRWLDSTNSATVTNVAIAGTDTVTLTLSNVPTGSNPKIGIADLNEGTVLSNDGNFVTSDKRSNLRDSNTDVDLTGAPMWNWAAHYQINVQ